MQPKGIKLPYFGVRAALALGRSLALQRFASCRRWQLRQQVPPYRGKPPTSQRPPRPKALRPPLPFQSGRPPKSAGPAILRSAFARCASYSRGPLNTAAVVRTEPRTSDETQGTKARAKGLVVTFCHFMKCFGKRQKVSPICLNENLT